MKGRRRKKFRMLFVAEERLGAKKCRTTRPKSRATRSVRYKGCPIIFARSPVLSLVNYSAKNLEPPVCTCTIVEQARYSIFPPFKFAYEMMLTQEAPFTLFLDLNFLR